MFIALRVLAVLLVAAAVTAAASCVLAAAISWKDCNNAWHQHPCPHRKGQRKRQIITSDQLVVCLLNDIQLQVNFDGSGRAQSGQPPLITPRNRCHIQPN